MQAPRQRHRNQARPQSESWAGANRRQAMRTQPTPRLAAVLYRTFTERLVEPYQLRARSKSGRDTPCANMARALASPAVILERFVL